MKLPTMTVSEVKQNLARDLHPGTYTIAEILLLEDCPIRSVIGKRRHRHI